MMDELREFTCEECGHRVVVNPKLPNDYTPNVCVECWPSIEAKRRKIDERIAEKLSELLKLIGVAG